MQEQRRVFYAEEVLPSGSARRSLWPACPANGCDNHLSPQQRQCFRLYHRNLRVVVQTYAPKKGSLDSDPLVLSWTSASLNRVFCIILAFRTFKPPIEMYFLKLTPEFTHDFEVPMSMTMFSAQAEHPYAMLNDMQLCVALAEQSQDWALSLCTCGNIGDDYCVVEVQKTVPVSGEDILQLEETRRTAALALRAAKLAQGRVKARQRKQARDTAKKGSRQRAHISNKKRKKKKSEEAKQPEQKQQRAPGKVKPSHPGKAKNCRQLLWGPFQLAPIVPASGQSGWGAICGIHHDREGSKTVCKKVVTYGKDLDDSTCVLRLKRWLCAGLHDSEFPPGRERSHHVSLGGVGLKDFESGMTEQEMDALIAVYDAPS